MQQNDSRNQPAVRRAVTETILLSVVFLIALFLFFTTWHFIAGKEADQELQKRPKGIIIGWLTTITIGLILGRTPAAGGGRPACLNRLLWCRESLQAM